MTKACPEWHWELGGWRENPRPSCPNFSMQSLQISRHYWGQEGPGGAGLSSLETYSSRGAGAQP